MPRTKYEQGNGFFVINWQKETLHLPVGEVSHLKSGKDNKAIVVMKSDQEIVTNHWMNRARKMLQEAIEKSPTNATPLTDGEIDETVQKLANEKIKLQSDVKGKGGGQTIDELVAEIFDIVCSNNITYGDKIKRLEELIEKSGRFTSATDEDVYEFACQDCGNIFTGKLKDRCPRCHSENIKFAPKPSHEAGVTDQDKDNVHCPRCKKILDVIDGTIGDYHCPECEIKWSIDGWRDGDFGKVT